MVSKTRDFKIQLGDVTPHNVMVSIYSNWWL